MWGNVKRHGKDGEIKRTRGSNLVCAVAENVFGGRELTGVAVAKVGFSRLVRSQRDKCREFAWFEDFPSETSQTDENL